MFQTDESKTYGVKYQARCIAAQSGERHHTCFLVGTLSLGEENEVHLVQLADDGSDVTCEGLFAHQHEIWDLAACPWDPRLFATVFSAAGQCSAAIWQMPGKDKPGSKLQKGGELQGRDKASIRRFLWHPTGSEQRALTLDDESLQLWDVDKGSTRLHSKASAGTLQQQACAGDWDPHDLSRLATTGDASLSLWDLRSMQKTDRLDAAHDLPIRDLQFNPRKPNIVMTTGDDSKIKAWDLRHLGSPLLSLPGHSHWTWRARYNPFHDELVLSSGTDASVLLWHLPSAAPSLSGLMTNGKSHQPATGSIFSELNLSQGATSPQGPLEDGIVASFTDFEDSVYGIAWSSIDPWVFASLSYDGRVVISVVPTAVRSKCVPGSI